ncbi:MAG TPA: AMP-binding protein, partial [Thermoanaerobaculia bacterium]|nr:AMP-binding protein [Thermoanaerobaculia bacterium]
MASNLIDLLRHRAEDGSGRGSVTFLEDGEPQDSFSFSELDRRARAIASFLQSHDIGGRALLLFPPGLDFIAAFFGCLYAKVIAVPAYPPHPSRLERTLPRLLAIADSARPEAVLTITKIAALAGELPERLASPRWLAVDQVDSSLADEWIPPSAGPDDLALLQYTSGSTATPKGVMVSHGNLIHNLHAIQRMFALSADDVSVSWLPSFHDMGLIDGILQPVFSGCESYVMSPAGFLQRPMRWLQAITRFGGTHGGGPSFAYDLCIHRARPEDLATLDLRTWRTAYNGAEPVRAETLRRFAETFAPCGFRAASLYPCYGLAEGTLIVTGATVDEGDVSRSVSAEGLKQGVALEPGPQEVAQVLISSGRAIPDTRIAIIDPETRLHKAPGEV